MLDYLAFGAHPDDVEMSAGGLLLKAKKQGKKIGIIDLTEAELSSNGTIETRREEIKIASTILHLDYRDNLKWQDGFFKDTDEAILRIVDSIRSLKPKILLAPSMDDRHPDHVRCSQMVTKAHFLAGLKKIARSEPAYRPLELWYYMNSREFTANFVIDISEEFDDKMKLYEAYGTQFYTSTKELTFINRPEFIEYVKARARSYGEKAGVKYAEPYFSHQLPIRSV